MSKKLLIILGISVLLIGGAFAYYRLFVLPNNQVANRCQGFDPNWSDFVDCYGMISIHDAWDENYLSLKDHVHNYEVARVYNQNQYFYSNNQLFVINRMPIENSSSNSAKTTYYQELFQNGEIVQNPYNAVSDIPTYLVIDTTSGEVHAYKSLGEVPTEDQEFFSRIQAN